MVPRSATWEFLNSRLSTGHDTPRKKAYQLLESDLILYQFKRKMSIQPSIGQSFKQSVIRCLTFWFKTCLFATLPKSKFPPIQGYKKWHHSWQWCSQVILLIGFFFGGRFPWLKCLEIRCILGNLTKKHVVKKSTNPTISSPKYHLFADVRNIPPPPKKNKWLRFKGSAGNSQCIRPFA